MRLIGLVDVLVRDIVCCVEFSLSILFCILLDLLLPEVLELVYGFFFDATRNAAVR